MKEQFIIFVVSAMWLAHCFPAVAQGAKRIPHIGYLTTATRSADSPDREAFRGALRTLGFVEGQNLNIETDSPKAEPSGSLSWQLVWFVSTLTLSSSRARERR